MQGNLHFDRAGDALLLRSVHTGAWLGAIGCAFSVCWTIFWLHGASDHATSLFGLLIGIFLIVASAFCMLPRMVTTVFDLRSERIVHSISICDGWYRLDRTYSFAEVECIAIKHDAVDGYSYIPVLELKNGQTRWLATSPGDYPRFAEPISALIAAAKLPGTAQV